MYGNVTLKLPVQLSDGTQFEGTDMIKVLFPGDVDDDGDVVWFDFSPLAAAYGTKVDDAKYNRFADLHALTFHITSSQIL